MSPLALSRCAVRRAASGRSGTARPPALPSPD